LCYSDSLGSAKYSRIKVDKLSLIKNKLNNKVGSLNSKVFKTSKALILEDINKYHTIFKKEKAYQEDKIDK
jgi:hypothetical protein